MESNVTIGTVSSAIYTESEAAELCCFNIGKTEDETELLEMFILISPFEFPIATLS